MMKKLQRGFTLIELMIVIAIIAIIAAIAIPNLIEARKSGNEAAAIGALKAISSAQAIFQQKDSEGDNTLDYGSLAELSTATLVDPVLGAATKQGYSFAVTNAEFTWSGTCSPVSPGTSGDRYFYMDQSGVIRSSSSGVASSTSNALK
jgi:prepilin-type N-terminal cleavage/methylation domain-containing protein